MPSSKDSDFAWQLLYWLYTKCVKYCHPGWTDTDWQVTAGSWPLHILFCPWSWVTLGWQVAFVVCQFRWTIHSMKGPTAPLVLLLLHRGGELWLQAVVLYHGTGTHTRDAHLNIIFVTHRSVFPLVTWWLRTDNTLLLQSNCPLHVSSPLCKYSEATSDSCCTQYCGDRKRKCFSAFNSLKMALWISSLTSLLKTPRK